MAQALPHQSIILSALLCYLQPWPGGGIAVAFTGERISMQITAGVCLLSFAWATQETKVSYTFQKVKGLMVIPVFCQSEARRCHSHCPDFPILVEISGNIFVMRVKLWVNSRKPLQMLT